MKTHPGFNQDEVNVGGHAHLITNCGTATTIEIFEKI